MNTNPPTKLFIGSKEFLDDSIRLAYQIIDSGFKPSMIIGVWHGGSVPGTTVKEVLSYEGIKTDYIPVRTSLYHHIGIQDKVVEVHALKYAINEADPNKPLLIVDDVFDSGNSINAIIKKLKLKARHNCPNIIKVATVYYKSRNNKQWIVPDFFIHETDKWLVFPYDLEGLTPEEIYSFKGLDLAALKLDCQRPVLASWFAESIQPTITVTPSPPIKIKQKTRGSSMSNEIKAVLTNTPNQSASSIREALHKKEINIDVTVINGILYKTPDRFQKDSSIPPKWCLC